MSRILLMLLAAAWQGEVPLPDNVAASEQARAERLKYMKDAMAEYRIYAGPKAEHELTLAPEPVYRWSRAITDTDCASTSEYDRHD